MKGQFCYDILGLLGQVSLKEGSNAQKSPLAGLSPSVEGICLQSDKCAVTVDNLKTSLGKLHFCKGRSGKGFCGKGSPSLLGVSSLFYIQQSPYYQAGPVRPLISILSHARISFVGQSSSYLSLATCNDVTCLRSPKTLFQSSLPQKVPSEKTNHLEEGGDLGCNTQPTGMTQACATKAFQDHRITQVVKDL